MDVQDAIQALSYLEDRSDGLSYKDAEGVLFKVLQPLLNAEGYGLEKASEAGDQGLDFLAERPDNAQTAPHKIAIQYKHFRNRAGVEVVRSIIGAVTLGAFDRVMLICSGDFTRSARDLTTRQCPITVELFGLDDLRSWATRIETADQPAIRSVVAAIKDLSRKLALVVACDSSELRAMEWRDTERMIAEVFEGLGFDVTLTEPAKDGGKDVILGFTLEGQKIEYYVEIKH